MSISLSRLVTTVTGTSDRLHPFTFEWQDKEHVKVYLNGTELTQDDGSDTSKFSITGTSGSATVNLGSAITIAADDIVTIQRETPQTFTGSGINFVTGPLTADAVNASVKHQIYLAQEADRAALDAGDKCLFTTAKSLGLNISASEGAGGGLTSASDLETDPADASAEATYFQAPTSFDITSSGGVQFKETGKYLVTLKARVIVSSTLSSVVLGFGSAESEAITVGADLQFEVERRFPVTITAPGSMRPRMAGAFGAGSVRYLEILVERVT